MMMGIASALNANAAGASRFICVGSRRTRVRRSWNAGFSSGLSSAWQIDSSLYHPRFAHVVQYHFIPRSIGFHGEIAHVTCAAKRLRFVTPRLHTLAIGVAQSAIQADFLR